ncbi:MAG: hypothetical protein ACHQ51_11175 [Elusimicrobiota bacterium]
MTKKWMAVLALAFAAPMAFGQTVAAVHSKKVKPVLAVSPAAGQMKVLRQEIKQDKQDLSAKKKAGHSERAQLAAQWQAELAKVKASEGNRAEKASARKALREKYTRLMKELRAKTVSTRKSLREDISSKSGLIKRLRQS